MSGRFLRINNHHLYVGTHGPKDGLPVVLLHHGIGAARSWKKQIPVLAAAGFRVVANDRWGHGKSEARSRYGIPNFEVDVADLECLMDQLEIERAALVGHSDGGKIALYFAARYPERVACLVIVATHVYIEAHMRPVIQGVLHDYQHDPDFRGKFRRVHGHNAEAVFKGWYEGWTKPDILDWDLRPVLRAIRCPALIGQGRDDEHVSPHQAADIAAAIPGAELWLVPGAGHMLPQDEPDLFNERLLEFLRKQTGELLDV